MKGLKGEFGESKLEDDRVNDRIMQQRPNLEVNVGNFNGGKFEAIIVE